MATQVQTKYQLQQIELEQNYIVIKDLSNVLGILVEYLAVKEIGNERLAAVFLNRFITQINISNAVHYETFYEAKQTNTQQNLKQRKAEATEIFEAVIKNLQLEGIVKGNDLDRLLNIYLNVNLSSEVRLQQTEINPSNENSQFTEQSLNKIVDAMSQTDNDFCKVHNGQMQKLTVQDQQDQIWSEVNWRYLSAQQRLKLITQQQNIPDNQTPIYENIGNNANGNSAYHNQRNQISQETKQIIQALIETLYQKKQSRDIIQDVLNINQSKANAVYDELCKIHKNLQSLILKNNIFEIGQVLLKQKPFNKQNFQFVNDKLDLPYLTNLMNGKTLLDK